MKGELKSIGWHKHSHEDIEFFECADCKTQYPKIVEWKGNNRVEMIKCNGYSITKCPWCREDTSAWDYGRGK